MQARAGRPPAADVLVAAAFLCAALCEVWVTGTARGPRAIGTVVALLSAVPLAWRRVAPVVSVAGATVAILLPLLAHPVVDVDGLFVTLAWLAAVHAINAYGSPRLAVGGTVVVTASAVLVVWSVPVTPGDRPGDVLWVVSVFGAACAAGQVMRRQSARLVRQAGLAEVEARAAERRKIARELHDVVAHGVAVMVVQAGAAQELVQFDPRRAATLLDAVQRTGAESAAELRRMLDLLGGERPGPAPQPSLADLPALVEGVRVAGIPATLDSAAGPGIAPGLQVTVYRVVQESLTNALKHGRRVALSVEVRSDDRYVSATVVDRADEASGAAERGSGGHGLQGLQERVRVYGGRLDAGPVAAGWRVRAVLPLNAELGASGADDPLARGSTGAS